ncbi:MAG: hypothetical protein AAGB05_00020 [Pseudomonadota bacterium]
MIRAAAIARWTALAVIAVLAGVATLAMAQEVPNESPIARVGPEAVLPADLEDALAAGRGQRPGATPEVQRQEVRDRLVAELWAQQVFGAEARSDPELAATLQEAERQILFQMYAQSQFEPEPPTDAEIDAYVAAHPAFFSERVEYRLQTFRILPELALGTADLAAIIAPLSLPPITEETTAELARALAASGIPFEQQNLWTGGETLPEPLRTRLEAMRVAERPVHITTGPDLTEIIVLFAARPAPINPEQVRDQVANRLVETAFDTFSRSLAAEIAAPLVAATQEQSDRLARSAPLSARLLAAIAVLGSALGLLWAVALCWVLHTRRLFRAARRESDDDALPVLKRPGPVTLCASVTAAVGTALVLGALATRPSALLSLSGLALLLGTVVLAGGFGMLLWRPTEAVLAVAHPNQRAAGRRVAVFAMLVGGLCVAFLAYPFLYQ